MPVIDVPGMGPVEFPDSMSDADIEQALQNHFRQEKLSREMEHPPISSAKPPPLNPYHPLHEMNTGEKMLAGVGQAITQTARGVGQLLGGEAPNTGLVGETEAAIAQRTGQTPFNVPMPTQSDVEEARRIDAPLLGTVPGFLGSMVGHGALMAPGAAAQTPLRAAELAGAYGLMQPGTATERAISGGLAAGGAAVGQKIGQVLGRGYGEATPAMRNLNKRAMDLGAKLTPGQMTRSSTLLRREAGMATSPSGGAKLDALKGHNQTLLNRLWTRAIGQEADEITPDYLGQNLNRIGDQIEQSIGSVNIPLDDAFQDKALNALVKYQRTISGKGDSMVDNALDWIVDQGKVIAGKDFQTVRSRLMNDVVNAYRRGDTNIGEPLSEILDALDDAAEKVLLPDQKALYALSRNQWKNAMAVERGLNGFNVSGPKMANYLKSNKFTKNAYLRGRGNLRPEEIDAYDMTRFASQNRSIVGDSGTATRQAPITQQIRRGAESGLVGGGTYMLTQDPALAIGATAAAMPAMEFMRRVGQSTYLSPAMSRMLSFGGLQKVSPELAQLVQQALAVPGASGAMMLPELINSQQ